MKINEIQESIIAEFSGFEDWLDMYKYLVELAGAFAPMDEKYKTDGNSISGCQSRLWLYGKCENGRMEYSADSDAVITKGIVSLILRCANGRPPAEIAEADLYFIDRIGLKSNLSPARSNGVSSIIKAVKESAEAAIDNCGKEEPVV